MPTNFEPIGFWSHTSSDDTASRGHLSRLPLLLADDVQRVIGREPVVHVFQDVAAILKGSDWEKKIHEAPDAASFIIPIVTPAFLQSEWCCKEVLRFPGAGTGTWPQQSDLPVSFHRHLACRSGRPGEVCDKAVLALSRRHAAAITCALNRGISCADQRGATDVEARKVMH
jgi:hypothetical protein